MPRYPVTDYQRGDIVLIEVKIYRFPCNLNAEKPAAEDGEPAVGSPSASLPATPRTPGQSSQEGKSRPWVHWFAEYQLHSVTLLFKGSEHAEEEVMPDDDGEE